MERTPGFKGEETTGPNEKPSSVVMRRLVGEDPAGRADRHRPRRAATWSPSPRPRPTPEDDRHHPSNFSRGDECVSHPSNQSHVLLAALTKELAFERLSEARDKHADHPSLHTGLFWPRVCTRTLPRIPQWSCSNSELSRSERPLHLRDDCSGSEARRTCVAAL